MDRQRKLGLPVPLLIILLLGLFRGGLYAFFEPAWGLKDEEQHVDYIRSLAVSGQIPVVGEDFIASEIIQSVLDTGRHEFFLWPTPLSSDPSQWSLEGYSYEGYQPPLFYLLFSPIYRLTPGPILNKLAVLRFCMVLLSLVTLWVLYRLTEELFPQFISLPVLVTSLLMLIPERTFSVSLVNNDVLLEVVAMLFAWVWVGALKNGLTTRRGLWLAFWFGLGILTKFSFAGLGLLFLPLWWWNRKAPHLLRTTLVSGLLMLMLMGPWLARNILLYGDASGMLGFDTLLAHLGFGTWNETFSLVSLGKQTLISFAHFWIIWWKGAIAVFPKWLWLFYAGLFLLCGVSSIELVKFLRHKDPQDQPARRAIVVFSLTILFYFILVMTSYYNSQFPVIQGRLFLPVMPLAALLLGFGLRQQAAWKKLWPALLGSLLVLDALFLFGNQLRYFYYIGPVQRNLQGVAPWSLVDQFRLAISEWGLHSWVNPNLVWLILAGSLFGLASWTWHISKIFRRPPQADFRPWLVEQGQRLKKINPLWWIAILYFLAALIWATSMPADTFWSLDEGGKYIYLQNVIQTGDLAAPLVYPGLEHDPGLNFVPLYFFIKQAGAIFSWWPVWFPLTSLPFFRIFGWAGLFCLPALAGAFSVFLAGLIFQTIQPQKPWLAQVAALLTGLATPLAFYATRYWEHTLASAFFLLAAWLLLRGMQNGSWWMFLVAGFSGALAAGFRLDVAPLLLGFGLYLLIKNFRPALLFGGSFVLSYLPLLIANRLVSGNFFGPTYISIQALQMGELLRNLHKTIPHILFNAPAVGAFALPRWMLIVGSLALLAGLVLLFIPRLRYAAIPFHLLIVLISGWVLFQPELYRSVHGLVLIAPLIVFGGWVLAFRGLWKQSPFVGMAVCGMGVFGIIYLLRGWSAAGGLQWGPRYMLSLYPLLIIFAVLALNQMLVSFPKHARTLAVSTFILAALIGVGYEVRGLDTARRTVNLYHSSGVVVRQITEPLIFTRCTWLGMVIPDLYWQGNLYTGDPAAWEANLQGQGFRNYLKLDMISCNTETIEKVEQAYKNIPGGITIETINLP